VAEGRLHLAAVCLLAPHLTPENADGLLAAAALKTKAEVELLLAQRFPRTELLPLVQAIPASTRLPGRTLAPGQVAAEGAERGEKVTCQLAPGQVGPSGPNPTVKPLAPERFALQFTIARETHDKLRHAQALLSHRLPSGDIAVVFDRALDALIGQLEKRKFAATGKPRPRSRRASANPRHIPASVKRAVRERDGDQCTFVSESGHRCAARTFLQFDHIVPVARGGEATVENLQVRCSGHNQLEAERAFGAGFMDAKRNAGRDLVTAHVEASTAKLRTTTTSCTAEASCTAEDVACIVAVAPETDAHAALAQAQAAAAECAARALAMERAEEVIPYLRALGFRAEEARQAAKRCEAIPEASLEERVRLALSCIRPPARRIAPVAPHPRCGP
jgi:hypothetical protein